MARITLLVASLALIIGTLPARATGNPAQQVLPADVSGTHAYQYIVDLARAIGPHAAGTPQDRASGEYIARQLTQAGYAVTWQPF